MNHSVLLAVLLLAPLVGFFINGSQYKKFSCNLAGGIATFAAFISFICSVLFFVELQGLPVESRQLSVEFFNWISVGSFSVPAGFAVDAVSAVMVLIITGIGSLIHLFSIGYMHHDHGAAKYFAYLNLFLFNMLLLVLGDNLLIMFVGWEGVGLCSYLLIGFWFSDKEKAAAGMKAFIANRVGDAGFLLGIFLIFMMFGTLQFQSLLPLVPSTPELGWGGPITLACLFLFIGATGKSAQIPLYVWLPDAMAGPTPVSALIHAATMVTAGVYMIIRLNPLFMAAPHAMMVIAIVGALTAFFAATIGLTQFDIKKVLAYSTVSQLGYMFLACGVGAFNAALFHLMTHAFFKALMFLGSGSVIHGMHEEQDIRKMGRLRKYLPITHATFLIGWLAIIGLPPFSGFFSKDEILWMAFKSPLGHPLLWVIGVLGAACTAFYMTRLMCLTFWGSSRVSKDVHPHESPWSMTLPLILLAVLSAFGGFVGIPEAISEILPGHPGNWLEAWTHGVIKPIALEHAEASLEWGLMGASVFIALISAFLAYNFYVIKPGATDRIAQSLGRLYNVVYHKYFIDELYFGYLINPLVKASRWLWFYVDVNVIDKTTYIMSDIMKGSGAVIRSLNSGNIQQYALLISMGVAVALSFILLR